MEKQYGVESDHFGKPTGAISSPDSLLIGPISLREAPSAVHDLTGSGVSAWIP